LPTPTDAGLDAIIDGPPVGPVEPSVPQICLVGTANCDTQVPDCEARIADAPACFPTYLGTTVLAAGSVGAAAMAVGDDGAVYLGGSFVGSVDFDPGPAMDVRVAGGVPDGFITKLNPDGTRAWTITFGANADVTSMSVSATSLTVVGGYAGTVDFDPGPGLAERTLGGGFVLKLTLDGVFSSVSTLDSGSLCRPLSMTQDANGDLYLVGQFSGMCDFDPGPAVAQRGPVFAFEAFVVKLGSDGTFRWVHTYEGSSCQGAALYGVAVSRDGNVWVTGQITGGCLLDNDLGRFPGTGALVAAFDPSGSPRVAWTLGPETSALGRAVVAGADGSVFVAGIIGAPIDFDPGPGVVMGSPTTAFRPAPRSDHTTAAFVLNLTSTGTFRSVYTMAGIDITALGTVADGGVLAMGSPVTQTGGAGGLFLTKLNADFSPGWSLYACGPMCGATALAIGRSTFLVAGGNQGDAADLDPGPAVDLVTSEQGTTAGVAFLSRYAF